MAQEKSVSKYGINEVVVTEYTLCNAVELSQDFEQMLISAERYACGRRSYIVSDTVKYILSLLPNLSDWCIGVMQNDLKSEFAMYDRAPKQKSLGDDCDVIQWERLRDALDTESRRRAERSASK